VFSVCLAGAVAEVDFDLTALHGGVLVHFLDGHAFVYEADALLKGEQLLISHNIHIHRLTK